MPTKSTDLIRVGIGIQARSTSTRLPRKIHKVLLRKSILEHVLDASLKSADYLNDFTNRHVHASVALLIPKNDEAKLYAGFKGIELIEGDERDVLSRYVAYQKQAKLDYVCRVTADCPTIPPFVISKLIQLTAQHHYDYLSNVDERCRTTEDGLDCEVISGRLLAWLDENATTSEDREHVTTLARRHPPVWSHSATVVNFRDRSKEKYSIDTEDDLFRVRAEMRSVEEKHAIALSIFGKQRVHRI